MNAPTLSPLASDLADILADALVADFLARPPAWALTGHTVESPPGNAREPALAEGASR
ncbi:MAG: hypothetical protein HY701_15040 [Gemmatimonadetes bacterium]|nr:hypothetical protein [Gemmatimonadota bacterium]